MQGTLGSTFERDKIGIPAGVAVGSVSNEPLGVPYFGQAEHDGNNQDVYSNYIDVVISSALEDYASLNINTPISLNVRMYLNSTGAEVGYMFLCKARGMVSKIPGFFFSKLEPTVNIQPVLMREDSFADIVFQSYQGSVDSSNEFVANQRNLTNSTSINLVPKQKLLIRFRKDPDLSQREREDLANGLRPFYTTDKMVVVDTQTVADNASSATDLVNL